MLGSIRSTLGTLTLVWVLAAAGCGTSDVSPDLGPGDAFLPDTPSDASLDVPVPPWDPGSPDSTPWTDAPTPSDVHDGDSPAPDAVPGDIGPEGPGDTEEPGDLPPTDGTADTANPDAVPPTDLPDSGDVPVGPGQPLTIAGRWVDDWGGRHRILDTAWEMVGMAFFHITDLDNEARWLVAQNDRGNDWNAGLWSRFDWTFAGTSLYYCQTAYAAASREEALATPPADATDPASGGCSGFPWSRLVPDLAEPLVLAGSWTDSWGGTHHISDTRWEMMGIGSFDIAEFHNDAGWLIAQNDPANEWNGGLWSRFDWTFAGTALYYCQTAYAAGAREEALATPPADATDPASGGCGGFPWTLLVPDATPAVADLWVAAPGHRGEDFQDADRAVNGVRGGGRDAGSTDVFSLGYEESVNNFLVLGFSGMRVRNGPGPDFVVFENPFEYAPGRVFMDLVVVYLSRDGRSFVPFPHRYLAPDPSIYVPDPALWEGFAGRHPVLLHQEDHPVDPFDGALAGGDPFDLDDLPDEGEAGVIRREGFAYLKLVTAPTVPNPDTGAPYVRDPASNGADIDGVVARYLAPR